MTDRDEGKIFVGEFKKNTLQSIKAHLIPWKRDLFCDVRIFETKADGSERPDIRGIRFGVDQIPELIGLLERVQERAPEEQLKIAALGGGNGDDTDSAFSGGYGRVRTHGRQRRW